MCAVRLIVALATCVLLVAVPAWAAARLGGDGSPAKVPPIDVRPGGEPVVTLPDGGFRAAASSLVHGARDCDDDGEVEFDDDDRCEADDRDDARGDDDDAREADDDPPGADDDRPGADDGAEDE